MITLHPAMKKKEEYMGLATRRGGGVTTAWPREFV